MGLIGSALCALAHIEINHSNKTIELSFGIHGYSLSFDWFGEVRCGLRILRA